MLPTIKRQHAWHPDVYVEATCPRCTMREEETWEHIIRCPGNEETVNETTREVAVKTVMDTVRKINKKREIKDSTSALLTEGEVANILVPEEPADDIGFLLGYPNKITMNQLKETGMRAMEIANVVAAAAMAAVEEVHKKVWTPRCDAVKERSGTWSQRRNDVAGREGRREEAERRYNRPRTRVPPREKWGCTNKTMSTDDPA